MRIRVHQTRRIFGIVGSAAAGLLGLCVSCAVLAGTCKKPNPNEKFCTEIGVAIVDCHTYDNDSSTACHIFICKDRKNFPDGDADHPTGTVKEELADCWRTAECIWDADTSKCNMPVSWGNYHKEDKVVTGTNPCPES